MADGSIDQSNMSIVPYDTNRDVVLQNANSVVIFDPESRQLILRDRNRDIDARSTSPHSCPACGRSYSHSSSTPNNNVPSEEQPTFINHGYFRMLARTLPDYQEPSVPPSPRPQLAHSNSTEYLDQYGSVPPAGAEFVGSTPAPPSPTHGISETAFTPQYFEKFFITERELGRGGRGVVLLVKHVLDGVNLGHFAVKRVPVGDDHSWLEKVLVEVQALQTLSHQNLVSYRHVWLQDFQSTTFAPSVPHAFILQQFCNGGDLHSYVCASAQTTTTAKDIRDKIRRKSRGEAESPSRNVQETRKLQFDEIYSFFRDITEGLYFLHLNGFIHRDLKPSNCLLHTVGDSTRVLVSDFGEVQYANTIRNSTGATGTISYCAPEVLQPVSPGGPLGNFTFKSDIFSLGMILHFLCFADLPYAAANVLHEEQEDLDALRGEIISWAGFDEFRRKRPELPMELYNFLKRLLSLRPELRPSAEDVKNGINRQNLASVPDLRRRNSQTPEELSPGRRIQNIDSPAPTMRRKLSRDSVSPKPGRRQLPSLPSKIQRDTKTEEDGTAIEDDEPLGAPMRRRASSRGGPSAVVLRPRPSVASPLPSPPPNRAMSRSPERKQRLLLEPPPQRRRRFDIVRHSLTARLISPTLYFGVFVIKLVSVLQPCMSRGMNGAVIYTILGMAAVEISLAPEPIWLLLLFGSLHGGILWIAYSHDVLCSSAWTPRQD